MNENKLVDVYFSASPEVIHKLHTEGYTMLSTENEGRYIARVTNDEQFMSKLKEIRDED